MSDDIAATGSRTRRQLLAGFAVTGTAAAAGCATLPWTGTDDESMPRFDPSTVESMLEGFDATIPDVRRPPPAIPEQGVVDDELGRVDDLLASVPDPIEPEAVPNGAIRESIANRRDRASKSRSAAAHTAKDERYPALRTARDAREDARAAATALDAIGADREQLLAALDDERAPVRSTLADRRESIAYRGPDGDSGRLRAALFYADLEADLDVATRRLDRWDVDANASVIDIGDAAGDLEFATATATIWEQLTAQYTAQHPEQVGLEPQFRTTLDTSIDRAADVDVSDQADDDWLDELVDSEIEQGFDQTILWEGVRPVYRSRDALREAIETGRLGPGLAEALRFEQEYRAFERVRDRFEEGELSAPESTAEIEAERTAGISAAETAIETFDHPSLAGVRLAETLQSLGWVDDALRRKIDGARSHSVSLSDEYSQYVCLQARFDALPDAVAAFRDRLLSQS